MVVQPKTGEKSFVIRAMVDGKQRKKTLGTFPALSLAEARDKAREVKVALRRGDSLPIQIGPAKPVLEPPRGLTVAEAWNLYPKHEGGTRKTAYEKQRILDVEVAPSLGNKPSEEVTREDLAALMRAKFETVKTSSNRLRSLLTRFFRWCVTNGHSFTSLVANPMASVVKMHWSGIRHGHDTFQAGAKVVFPSFGSGWRISAHPRIADADLIPLFGYHGPYVGRGYDARQRRYHPKHQRIRRMGKPM